MRYSFAAPETVPVAIKAFCTGHAMSHLYQQLAHEIQQRIQEGLLQPGDRLSGVREISDNRGISIATVVTAYRRLEDDGWIEARPRSGFYVRLRNRRSLLAPSTSTRLSKPGLVKGQELVLQLVKAATDPNIVQLGTAVPDTRFLPTQAVQQALSTASRKQRLRALGYDFVPGLEALRREIALRMDEAGCHVHPDEIIITNGCQEALTVALRAVTKAGDVVVVESPAFYGMLQVLDALGLKALEIPSDPHTGLSLDALQKALTQWPVKACVLVPNFSNPLGFLMSDAHKRGLVRLLSKHGAVLIEDDAYGDLGFSGRRPSICKAFDPEVIYCSSFSKTMAPGLRIGWVAAGSQRDKVEYQKFVANLGNSPLPQLATVDVLHSGRYERHLRQMRRDLQRSVEQMIDAIERMFPAGTRISQPQGGFVLWLELPYDIDTVELANRTLACGVSIAPGPIFSPTQRYRNCLRLSCAAPWEPRVERALARLVGLIDAMARAG